jgi:hypothetical protein
MPPNAREFNIARRIGSRRDTLGAPAVTDDVSVD